MSLSRKKIVTVVSASLFIIAFMIPMVQVLGDYVNPIGGGGGSSDTRVLVALKNVCAIGENLGENNLTAIVYFYENRVAGYSFVEVTLYGHALGNSIIYPCTAEFILTVHDTNGNNYDWRSSGFTPITNCVHDNAPADKMELANVNNGVVRGFDLVGRDMNAGTVFDPIPIYFKCKFIAEADHIIHGTVYVCVETYGFFEGVHDYAYNSVYTYL